MTAEPFDTVVVGGGFFGATLATHVARGGARTLLLEAGPHLLGRASAINQARVHAGYHYPRSYLTGLRSRVNAPHFIEQYRECIYDAFTHYYAIGRVYSNVSAAQFRRFCERIDAPVAAAPPEVRRLFNPVFIEDVVEVPEFTFDADRLRERVARELGEAGVEVRLGAEALRVSRAGADGIEVQLRSGDAESSVIGRRVFNCTYSRLNRLHAASGLPIVPLKHELTEMALVTPPPELAHAGVTVMCGPFFSMLPFPPRGLHTLSHVRYTPHCSWSDAPGAVGLDGDEQLRRYPRISHFPHMVRDAARYLPLMRDCRAVESLWEVKTVLPRSEVDDSRPILFSRNHGLAGFHCVIGSKVDNAFDMLQYVVDAPEVMEPAR